MHYFDYVNLLGGIFKFISETCLFKFLGLSIKMIFFKNLKMFLLFLSSETVYVAMYVEAQGLAALLPTVPPT